VCVTERPKGNDCSTDILHSLLAALRGHDNILSESALGRRCRTLGFDGWQIAANAGRSVLRSGGLVDLEVPLVSGGYSRCLFVDARGD